MKEEMEVLIWLLKVNNKEYKQPKNEITIEQRILKFKNNI
jgi:hypothetical protein